MLASLRRVGVAAPLWRDLFIVVPLTAVEGRPRPNALGRPRKRSSDQSHLREHGPRQGAFAVGEIGQDGEVVQPRTRNHLNRRAPFGPGGFQVGALAAEFGAFVAADGEDQGGLRQGGEADGARRTGLFCSTWAAVNPRVSFR